MHPMTHKAPALFAAVLLAATLAGCSRGGSDSTTSPGSAAPGGSVSVSESVPETAASSAAGVSADAVLEAVRAAYGEDYLAGAELPAEVLEAQYGLTPDMYTEARGETAMMSVHPDTVIIVRAAEGRADDVEAALTAARRKKVEDTVQYPVNIPKTNASQVLRNGDYVAFLLVGAPLANADVNEEDIVRHFEDEIGKGVEAFNSVFA